MSASEVDIIILPQHLYTVPYLGRVGYCAAGARRWWMARGLSWADFVAHGIPASVLLATGDPMALAVVAHAQAQAEEQTHTQEGSHGRQE